jgi:hypothetical protein
MPGWLFRRSGASSAITRRGGWTRQRAGHSGPSSPSGSRRVSFVLEYIEWDDLQPVLLQLCGAAPKGSVPFYRLITDARYGNRMHSD